MSFNNEFHVNQRQTRWVDRLSPQQYNVFLVGAVLLPTFTAFGITRTIMAYNRHKDTKLRVVAGKMFLKNICAFNHKFYPYLLPKVKIGAPIPENSRGETKIMFPNLSDLKGLGKGVTEYNWRNGDFASVQKSLKRVDGMTVQDIWTFTTLYTLVSNQKPAYELVDKIMRWVIKGEVHLDDVRAANVPEFAKYDLSKDQFDLYEKEGWKSVELSAYTAHDFAKRYQSAEDEFKKKGGKGLFMFKPAGAGDYQETLSVEELSELKLKQMEEQEKKQAEKKQQNV